MKKYSITVYMADGEKEHFGMYTKAEVKDVVQAGRRRGDVIAVWEQTGENGEVIEANI